MKILHFVDGFFPIYGGTTTRLYNLLSDEINEQYLYVPQAPCEYIPDNIGVLKNDEDFGNIKVRRYELVEDFKIKIPVIDMYRYVEVNSDKLVNFVKEDGIEIVHGHNSSVFAVAATKYAEKENIPFVYEAHGLMTDLLTIKRKGYGPKILRSFIQQIVKLKEKKIFQRADIIITQTNAMKQRIMSMFDVKANKINIIPNGVDEIMFDPNNWDQKGKEMRKERNWVNKIIFMYSGYLNDINGIDFLLNSVKELSEDIKQEIKVVILGRGPLQKYVEDMSKKGSDLIEYLGLVNYNDMPMYYSACDVFVIPRPSTLPAENLIPMKLLEAMAMEKIVLGSDVGGITEVLMNNKNGIIFRKGEKNDLFKKIRYIVENIGDMESIRKQARIDITNRYSWQKSREKLQDVYENLLSESTTYKKG